MRRIQYVPIGLVHSPYTEPEGMPIQPVGAVGVAGSVEIFPEYREGLADLDGFSHLYLLYHFHRVGPCRLTVKPFLDAAPHGVFSTRSPPRPNPIGISVVRLVRISGCRLDVEGIDVVDGTPCSTSNRSSPRSTIAPRTGSGGSREGMRQ